MQSFSHNGITWFNAVQPDERDLSALADKYGFHRLDIDDCLSENERPKIEEYENYLFFVIHIPYKAGERIMKEEINIFLGKDFIGTIHEGKIGIIDKIWNDMQESPSMHEEYFKQGPGYFLYLLLHDLFDRGFLLIEGLMKELRRIELELFEHEDERVQMLRSILSLKRNIITMRSILSPERSVIALMQHKNERIIPNDLDIYFDDIVDAVERQWTLLDTAVEMSDALQDTHEAWLSHRTNSVIRILTIFSGTMLPLTFITGLYGMNVDLPFQESQHAFAGVLLAMSLILASFLSYFAWKRWL